MSGHAAAASAAPASNVVPFPVQEMTLDAASELVAGIPDEEVVLAGFTTARVARDATADTSPAAFVNAVMLTYLCMARVLIQTGRL